MLKLYRDISPAARRHTIEHEHLLYDAGETAMREGRWRRHDLDEYVLAVARQYELSVWPALLQRVREAVRSAPSAA